MDSRLSSGLSFWLNLPGWLLLVAQGLGIGTLALLGGGWLLQDGWRQRENAAERQQRLLQQISMVQHQLDEAPEALCRQRRSVRPPPAIWRTCCNKRGRLVALAAAGKTAAANAEFAH